MYLIIFPNQLIRYVFLSAQQRKICIPVRKIIALTTVNTPCRRMQVPQLVMGYIRPVSYTHLDVYKRQVLHHRKVIVNALTNFHRIGVFRFKHPYLLLKVLLHFLCQHPAQLRPCLAHGQQDARNPQFRVDTFPDFTHGPEKVQMCIRDRLTVPRFLPYRTRRKWQTESRSFL